MFVHYLDVNYGKNSQNSLVPSQPAGLLPVYGTDYITCPQSVSMLTEDTGLALPSHLCTELSRYRFTESGGLMQNSSIDQSIQDGAYTQMNGDWPVNGEIMAISKMTSGSFEFSQNSLEETFDGQLTRGEEHIPLLSPIGTTAAAPCESPYSELFHWLGSPGSPNLLNGDSSELTVSEPAVLEGMEVSPSVVGVDHIPSGVANGMQSTIPPPSLSSEHTTHTYPHQQVYHIPAITDFSPEWSYPEASLSCRFRVTV